MSGDDRRPDHRCVKQSYQRSTVVEEEERVCDGISSALGDLRSHFSQLGLEKAVSPGQEEGEDSQGYHKLKKSVNTLLFC